MLMKQDVIYQRSQSPQDDESVRHITGQYLAKNWLSARERAQLAADIINGRVAIDPSTLTVGQISKICRANNVYVSEVRFPDRVRRRQARKLKAIWEAIRPDGRMELCRVIGVERIWNALVAAL
jgi:hypothetical protein